jgi:hypothetical protein
MNLIKDQHFMLPRKLEKLKMFPSSVKNWIVEKWKAALIVIGIILVPLVVWKVPEWQVRAYHGRLDTGAISKLTPQELIQLQKDLITAENNARVTIAQIVGGFGLLVGLYLTYRNIKIAHRNVEVAEEGKLTDRFSKAVELLGSDKLDVRLGGIYALERIARDSQKDHWTVMEVLTAFVREKSKQMPEIPILPTPKNEEDPVDYLGYFLENRSKRLPADFQVVLTVIGRRKWADEEKEHQRIDLSNSFLVGANLHGANLQRAIFNSANLTLASLHGAKLRGAQLHLTRFIGAALFSTDLIETSLMGAKFNCAILNETKLIGAELLVTDFRKATLQTVDFTKAVFADFLVGATLTGVDLSTSIGLTWEQLSKAIIDETTKLPPELEERRKAEQGKKQLLLIND